LRLKEEYAGKKVKCPKCAAIVAVPAPTTGEPVPKADVEKAVHAVRATPPPLPEAGIQTSARRKSARSMDCPRCGEPAPADAERCEHCGARLAQDEAGDGSPAKKRATAFKPCPRCGASGAKRVTWTPWGSFYGPAMCSHVRCPECGYKYNGRTGRSNIVAIVLFITIPLLLIAAIVGGLIFWLITTDRWFW
jgi:predicted RNA-binding Zn-ribbon protein involved in translation (DUF1610 family)